jgi:hypothetical protein
MNFPTMAEVEKAGKVKLAYWYRFYVCVSPAQRKILDRVAERLEEAGGMTKELSEEIGYGGIDTPKVSAPKKKTRPATKKRVSSIKPRRKR